MTVYVYKGFGADGKRAHGRIEASSTYNARALLTGQQFSKLQLREDAPLLKREIVAKKVKRETVMHFSRQLSAFIRAGVPMVDALLVISKEADNERFAKLLIEVADALRAGEPFAAAMASHPDVFPQYYLDILHSAELTGALDTVLDQLAGYLERDLEARRRVTSALVYPAIVMGMAVVTVVALTGFVLPRFKDFFESFDAKLPLPTRMLIWIGDFVGTFWWAILGVLVLGGLGLWTILRTEEGKARRDALFLKLPVIGEVVRYAVLERFCRILAAMVKAGVPLPEAMDVATDSAGNRVYRKALVGARDRMLNGEGLAQPLEDTGLFPGVASQMLRVGEETGSVDRQLQTASEFYELELTYKIKHLTTLFEPAVIVLVGVMVGFVAIALVSAMYGIFNQVEV